MPTESRFDDLDLHEEPAREGSSPESNPLSDNPQCCSKALQFQLPI